MSYNKLLTIIVPVYNVERYLEQCIQSLLAQDIPQIDYEILLINDGSTDKSFEIAKRYKDTHENIILLTQENKGQAAVRNRGVKNANGEYIMFVDSDDMLLPNVLKNIIITAKEYNLDVCAYKMVCYDSKGNMHDAACQPFSSNKVYDGKYAIMHGADIGSSCIYLYKHKFLIENNLKFLEGIYHEDVEFVLRMYAYIKRIMYLDIVAYSYTWNPNSTDRHLYHDKRIKQICDEFIIIKSITDFAETYVFDKDLKEYYLKHNNSMLVSLLLGIIKNRSFTNKTKKTLLTKMKNLFYPLKGKTLSWKTSLLIPFFNIILKSNKDYKSLDI